MTDRRIILHGFDRSDFPLIARLLDGLEQGGTDQTIIVLRGPPDRTYFVKRNPASIAIWKEQPDGEAA